MERALGAQLSHMLKDRGVTHVFGIPGVHNQELYRGIEEAGLVHVLARHEQGAGFMADGYARATGKPGVAYVITGPGLCNIMTPMGQAYSDSVPMLVIASCLDETAATRGQLHQMLDQRAAGATVSDWSEEARSADAAYALIDRALSEFEVARPRTKAVHVPISVLEARAVAAPARLPSGVTGRAAVDPAAVKTVTAALQQAERPVFILGGGARFGVFYDDLVRKLGAAVFCSYAGRGVIAPDNPYYLGSTLARPDSVDVLAGADLVVVIGCELAQTDLWRRDAGHSCPTIRIDIDPDVMHGPRQAGDVQLVTDAQPLMAAVYDALDGQSSAATWTLAEISGWRARWRAAVEAERPGIVPVAEALRDCLPDGTMIYSDMTQFAYAAKEVWDMDRPGHWHHPTGFGTLGYATPAAIGGAVARPGLPTMAIIGDYGFQYTVQELATAMELGLPIPIFLWDNGKLGEIEASMVAAQIAPNAVVQRNPDFLALAQAYGAQAAAPETLAEMQAAVREAFSANGPTVIRVGPGIA